MEELKHMSRIIRELDLKTARQIVGRQLGKAYFITPHGNLLPLDDDDTNETLLKCCGGDYEVIVALFRWIDRRELSDLVMEL